MQPVICIPELGLRIKGFANPDCTYPFGFGELYSKEGRKWEGLKIQGASSM